MHYLYTKTNKPISKDNLFIRRLDMKLTEFDRRSPINEKAGIVVMAHAATKFDLLKKKEIILKNMERK